MKHLFDVDVAKEYGVNCAILLEHLNFWIEKNEANESNYFDGNYWTFNSRKALKALFPYLSEKTIYNALQKLIDSGLVITGNYNAKAYDRTLWYALTEKGRAIVQNSNFHCVKVDNGLCKKGQPIPDKNADNNTHIIQKDIIEKVKRFVRPTLQEVTEYIAEIKSSVSPEKFYNYYESVGWKRGKTPVKDWKATVRSWEAKEKPTATTPKYSTTPTTNSFEEALNRTYKN